MLSIKKFLVAFVTIQSILIITLTIGLGLSIKFDKTLKNDSVADKIENKADVDKLYKQKIDEIINQDLSYNYIPGELMVKLNTNLDDQLKSKINSIANVDDFEFTKLTENGVYKLNSKAIQANSPSQEAENKVVEPLKNIIRELKDDPSVEYVELNQKSDAAPTYAPNDPSFPEQWNLNNTGSQVPNSVAGVDIKAKDAWNITTGSSNIKIAVIDSGFDITHGDLVPNLDAANAYDFADNDTDVNTPAQYKVPVGFILFHGSAVSGIAAGKGNDGLGMAGVCFQCKMLPIKVFSDSSIALDPNTGYYKYNAGGSTNAMLTSAINYAVTKSSKVINISLGNYPFSAIVQSTIDAATNQGTIIVAGAGNNSSEALMYPAAYNNVVAVAGLLANNTKMSVSNYGSWVDISAPVDYLKPGVGEGNGVTAPWYKLNGINYSFSQSFGGTSAAAPQIAGIVGLMLSKNERLNNQQIVHILTHPNSVDDVNASNPTYAGKLGAGRANAFKALNFTPSKTNVPDNIDDILLRNSVDGTNALWKLQADGNFEKNYFVFAVPDNGWKIVGRGDFDNDGVSDIFWSHSATGETSLWKMYGDTTIKSYFSAGYMTPDWKVAGIADFNNDNKSDIMWRNSTTGENKIWIFNSTSNTFSSINITTVDNGWTLGAFGKIDNDSIADILWYHKATGDVIVWNLNSNGTIKTSPLVTNLGANSGWNTAGISDFDGDGRVDVLWRNSIYGYNGIWKFNTTATAITSVNMPTLADQNNQVVGFGKHDGDTIGDILWQNKVTGEIFVWTFNSNGTLKQSVNLPNLGQNTAWEVKATGKWL